MITAVRMFEQELLQSGKNCPFAAKVVIYSGTFVTILTFPLMFLVHCFHWLLSGKSF